MKGPKGSVHVNNFLLTVARLHSIWCRFPAMSPLSFLVIDSSTASWLIEEVDVIEFYAMLYVKMSESFLYLNWIRSIEPQLNLPL